MSKETFVLVVRINLVSSLESKAAATFDSREEANAAWEIAKNFIATFCNGGKVELLSINKTLTSILSLEFPSHL